MVLHVAAAVALFVDTVQQAPIMVQCVQAPPEPLWKSLLQIAQIIVPVAGGVWIAWMAFRWNSRKEHEQWVRDQKKADWRELLKSATGIQRVLRRESMTSLDKARMIEEKLKPMVHELSITSGGCVFLYDFFSDPEKRGRFDSFLVKADAASESISGTRGLLLLHSDELTGEERGRQIVQMHAEVNEVMRLYLEFCEWLRKESAKDLGVAPV